MTSKDSIESSTKNGNLNVIQPTFENQSNNEEQNEMPNYMTDFILDFLNRSVKNEQETADADHLTGREREEEESVQDLIERAERQIREGMQHFVHNDEEDGNSVNSSHNVVPINNTLASIPPIPRHEPSLPYVELSSDDDDAVIFVASQPSVIPVIDLSSPSLDDRIQPTSKSLEPRKRNRDSKENISHSSADHSPVEKQYRHNCAVCLEDVKDNQPHSTVCGHIFCGDCIKKTVKLLKKCPTCNKKLKLSNIHPIYL